jgi:outer membrane receptor protein involved in Fe transport
MKSNHTVLALALLAAFPMARAQVTDPATPMPAQTGAAVPPTGAVEEQPDKPQPADAQTLPMSKEVASGEALRGSQDGYTDAVKNQAGISPANSKGSPNDSINIRGIKLNLFSNYRLNGGLPIAGIQTTPTEDKQRIETLKGANALMFGVASPAGIINLVTKRALDQDVTSFMTSENSFGQIGFAADIGRRFGDGKQLGARVNLSTTKVETGVRNASGHGSFASLGADYDVTSRLAIQADIEYYRRDSVEQGSISLPAVKNGVIIVPKVPDPRNLLSGQWAQYQPRTENDILRADYKLDDDWKVMAEIGRSLADRSRLTTRFGGYDVNTGANATATISTVTQYYKNSFARSELTGWFDTWSLRHDLTVGIANSVRDALTPAQNTIVEPGKFNIFSPPAEIPEPIKTNPDTSLPLQRSKDTGIYTYDSIDVGPQWKFLLGVRHTNSTQVSQNREAGASVISPALGFLYNILPTTTLFASYMKGQEDGAVAPNSAANAYQILAPGISTQKEIGLRDTYFKGISISASYFDIKRVNAVTDPITKIYANNGNTVFRGIESVVAVEMTRTWTLNSAAQWLHAVQHSDDMTINGLAPENTPEFIGNLSVTHRNTFVEGLSVNAGTSYVSARPVDPQNHAFIPAYELFNAGASYNTRISGYRTEFQMSIDNIGNRRYWNSVQTGTLGTGMDRSVKFNAKVNF